MIRNTLFILLLCVGFSITASADTAGSVKGTLLLDNSWDRKVYLSLLETFEEKNAVSDKMIIASSVLDSLGRFEISLEKFPVDLSLVRLHVTKKGSPAASLIIGGADENHCFILLNRNSTIELFNEEIKPVFRSISLKGESTSNTLRYIDNLSEYANSIDYSQSIIEKEFIEEVVTEKLKQVADTSSNLLVSLYALYQIDFRADFKENPKFYKNYLSKWDNDQGNYLNSFKRQLPVAEPNNMSYLILLLGIGMVVAVGFWFWRIKNSRLKKLSVQEQKIFELLKSGATNQEIAEAFSIELSTVKSHVTKIFAKLKIKSRKEILNRK
ncbi:LuxR family transcriptional regulator [Prolixibacteraceae bacterium JC049]|nr:LuxR family transcriptional regulator [Prolixibacteraceae bacterium JC049]